jgi:hypothetical protein
MLENSSLFLMLLLGAGSIIGIRSAAYDQPEVAIAQPQPQPQKPIPGTQGLITQQRAETLAQASVDKILLDRLFPQIIKRIDGNTLLQKIDAKTLAAKVLPYLTVNINTAIRYAEPSKISVGTTPFEKVDAKSSSTIKCNEGERAVGGGFLLDAGGDSTMAVSVPAAGDSWFNSATFQDDGYLRAYVTCLTANVGLSNAQPPLQPPSQQPSGGPIVR